MSEDTKQKDVAAPRTHDEPLSDDTLDPLSGGGQDGSDLLIWNNGDGSDFSRPGEPTDLKDEPTTGESSSDPEWKYVPVRRTT